MVETLNKSLIEPEFLILLTKISGMLAKQKVKSYVVGGFVRDALLGRDTADIDIAVNTDSAEIAPKLAELLSGKFFMLDEVNRTARITLKSDDAVSSAAPRVIDIASFKGKIEADLERRDFTVNAMALDLASFKKADQNIVLIDPFDGQTDLERGILRIVTKTALGDDPVRLLRAVRLAVELGFNIEQKTEMAIEKSAELIAGVSGERVREEFLRLLDYSHGGDFLEYMDKLGLLTAIFPELIEEKGVVQPAEHHWDVFGHSLKTVTAVDFILHEGIWEHHDSKLLSSVPWTGTMSDYFMQPVSSGSNRRILIKLAALLHDIAKPQTKAFDGNGRMRFIGHPEEGATVVESIMERLRFSVKESKLVAMMVKYHLRPTQMSQGELPSQRAIYRYFRDVGDAGIDTLYFSLADHLATRGPGLLMPQWKYHTQVVDYVLKEHFRQGKIIKPVKLVNGDDLVKIFRMTPGKKVGKLLEVINEAQATGELNTREEALDYIRNSLLAEGK
jgi:poly(A) polymerase